MSDQEARLAALLRTHFYSFVWRSFNTLYPDQPFEPTWHVEVMCAALQKVADGKTRRLLITVPPRHLKSFCVSISFSAWLLGHRPDKRILVASYGQDLANKHARDFRALIETPFYQRLFPAMRINPRRNTEAEIETTAHGGRKAVSVGGATTGFGADALIIDDLMKAADGQSDYERQRAKECYEQTLYSRSNDKQTTPIVAIQQRLHEDDFAGYLIDKGNFEHLNLRAIAEEDETFDLGGGRIYRRRRGEVLFEAREPKETLDEIRREIGAPAFSSQYQQNPVPPGGNRIRWDWFRTYDQVRPRDFYQLVVQSWDTALTTGPRSDFSVCTTWGFREGVWYLLDLYRERLEFGELKRRVKALKAQWRANYVVVEGVASGMVLVQELRKEGDNDVIKFTPKQDKETRVAAQTALLETGNYRIPAEADWLGPFKREVMAFPNGRHDDQVDSMVQFIEWSRSTRGANWIETELNDGRPVRPLGSPGLARRRWLRR